MQREDQLSLQYEKQCHLEKFKQAFVQPPPIPQYLLPREGGPL